jgi:sugar lactone lactonase YvrE
VLLTTAAVLSPQASGSTNRIHRATRVASTNQSCRSWTVRTVASGLGVLENLTFDRQGSMFISATQSGAIERMTPDGHASTVVPDVSYPGGVVVHGDTLYFNTGDSPQAGILGTQRWDDRLLQPGHGHPQHVEHAPGDADGLAFLPGGDAVVTRVKPVLGTPTGITRIPAADPTHPQFSWVALNDTNGLMLDPTGSWLYTDQTFTTDSAVYRIRVSDPTQVKLVGRLASAGVSAPLGNAGLGQPKGLDDMASLRMACCTSPPTEPDR